MTKRVSSSRQAPLQTVANDEFSQRAKAWIEKSCAEQGVPAKITDPLVLAKVADILLEGREKRSLGGR